MLKKVTLPKNINSLKETEFEFIKDEIDNPLDGVKFTMNKSAIEGDEKNIYYIIDDGSLFVKIKWYGGGHLKRTFKRDRVIDLFKRGVWEPYFGSTENIKESENDDFDWVRDTNPKEIDNYYKIVLDFFDWGREYKEYSYSANDVGAVEWYKTIFDEPSFSGYYFYATPYWEGSGVMKVTAEDDQGHEIELHTIPLPKFKYEEQLKEWLRSEYPKIVYEEIKHFEDTQQYSGDTLNEIDSFDWVGQVNKDLIKLGSVFTCDEGEKFVINHISPPNQLTIKSLDFPKNQEDTSIISSWTKDKFLELLDKGDLNYVGDMSEFIKESKDLQWIKDVGTDRIDLVKKIKETLADHGVGVEWEREHLGYNQEATDGSRGEVFAKFFYDTGDRAFFIELIESENGLYGFHVYEYNEKYDTYYINTNYNSLGIPRLPDEFWRHVCWTVLNQMDAFPKKDKVTDLGDYLNESEDFDWVEDVTPRMDATLLKPGQKFYDKWGDVIRVLEYLGRDGEGEICYKPPCTLLRFRKIKDPSGYRMIPGLPADDPQNTDMIMIPSDFDRHIESGKLKLVSNRTMYESEEEIEIGDGENITQDEIDYINTEYGSLKNKDEIKKVLEKPPFNYRPSQATRTSSINGYVVRYIVSKEANRDNTDVFTKENFEEFLDKVNSVLGTNYENIKGFEVLTSTKKPKKEGALTQQEILMKLFNMSEKSIGYWLDLKDDRKREIMNKPISPEQYQERLNKLVNFLSTIDVINLDLNLKTLLEKFNLFNRDIYSSEEIKDKYFNDIIKFFEGDPKVNFFIRFIFNKVSEIEETQNVESWKVFVGYSKAIKEIIENNKLPEEKNYRLLKTYFNKIKEKGYCYIFSENCELSNSDVEKVMNFFGETYENSFLNKGFKKDSKGVESRIHNLGNVNFNFSEKIKSDDFDVDEVSNFIIENIKNYLNKKDSITKYDLLANGDIKDSEGNVIIPDDGKVEVKDINRQDSYLSEFLASPVKRTEYGIRNNPIYLKRYNEVIGKVYDYVNKNKKEDIIDKIKVGLSGIIVANNIYIPNKDNNIEFYLSNVGRSNPEKQLRITVRYHINQDNWKNFYKIGDDGILYPLKEKPNIPTREKRIYEASNKMNQYDGILNGVVEKFYDTDELELVNKRTMYESEDFGWAEDLGLSSIDKNKSYVLDVRNLDLSNVEVHPRSSVSKKEALLDDFLYHLSKLGYNVNSVRREADRIAESIKYLYLNNLKYPNTMVVEFDDMEVSDITYGGTYEIVDSFKDFYFMVKNGLVNESIDWDWIRDVKPYLSFRDVSLHEKYGIEFTNYPSVLDLFESCSVENSSTKLKNTKYVIPTIRAWSKASAIYCGDNDDVYEGQLLSLELSFYDKDGVKLIEDFWIAENNLIELKPFDDNMVNESKEDKKTITEAAGISFEARKWGEIIYNQIMDNPNEKKRLIIDGYDHPEAFDGFPIDYVVIDFYDRLTGYGQEHSGYDKDGNYVVLLYIQPKLVQGQGEYDLRSVLNHEMKHAWDDYNRLSKGQPSIDSTKENRELYNKDFILMLSDKNIHGPIKELLKYYYYLSELEKTAYLENVYDGNLNYEKIIRDISSKDFESFKDRFDLDINWHLMNTAYDIPFLKRFKSPIEFIDYSSEELRSKAIGMIKKINKMKYVHNK